MSTDPGATLTDPTPADRYHARPLGALVGVGRSSLRSARVWMRLPSCRQATVGVQRRDQPETRQTTIVELPEASERDHTHAVDLARLGHRLDPDTAYDVVVIADGHAHHCRFRTTPPPTSRERICFAVGSCHDPFREDGHEDAASMDFLRAIPDCLASFDARHTFLIGDQVYSDLPASVSLFHEPYFRTVAPPGVETVLDARRAQVRRLYQQRYHYGWKGSEWRALQAATSTSMLLDDHDIVDNFGTAPEHSTERWRALREGALDAYHDYQGSRFLEARGPHASAVFDLGRIRVIQLDIRSERRHVDGHVQVFDQAEAFLDRALREGADASVLCIAIPVPIAHVPDWLIDHARTLEGPDGDAADRWSAAPMRRARDRFLARIRAHQAAHPGQRVLFLSGDTHAGAIGQIAWADGTPPALQLVSSAISNAQAPWVRLLSETAPSFVHRLEDASGASYGTVSLLEAAGTNPFGRLNLGLVEVAYEDGRDRVRLTLVGATTEAPGWSVAAQTDWL